MRLALGVRYNGRGYEGWQSQRSGRTVQDRLEAALAAFAATPVSTLCAGRTDAGVHGLMQVVHFDTGVERPLNSWVRGTNRYLPDDIAVRWAQRVAPTFHCRGSALARRYRYLLSQSPVRPSLDTGRVGWTMYPLDGDAMRAAAAQLMGTHDFSAFRASACQARSPVKTLTRIDIQRQGEDSDCRWVFDFEADAFLHHMIRNIMGCLVRVGQGAAPPGWMTEVLQSRQRKVAAPTFAAAGLYFVGPLYGPEWNLPRDVTLGAAAAPAYDGLP